MKIIAGDIGGTKTLLQVAEPSGDGVQVLHEQRYDSNAYSSFSDLLDEFLKHTGTDHIDNCCIGVAGPVRGSHANVTNLPWELDAEKIKSQFNMAKVRLINDFQAVGYGIELLRSEDIVTLQTGEPLDLGTRAVIGAGTGLGEGILVWQGNAYEVLSSEGGHVDFAPTDTVQLELLQYMQKKHQCVSYELVCSGPGLENIYQFLSNEIHLPAAQITQYAQTQEDPLARQALDVFISIYGAQAGNLALTALARGGLYIAGGVAPRIIGELQGGAFMQAFCRKSKMQPLLETIPVHVVINPKVGLLGAEAVAAYHM
ncbi:glucokinase [Kaarinaea lacus]